MVVIIRCKTLLDGEGLEKAILFHIKRGMDEYAKEKMDILKNVGDPIPYLIQVTSTFDSQEEYWNSLIDFAIGQKENLPVAKLVVKEDVRFGIPASVREESERTISFTTQPIVKCNITFKNESNNLVSSFEADGYAPNWFFLEQDIPKAHLKERIVFEIGYGIVRPFPNESNFYFNFTKAKSINSIVDHANLWRLVMIINESSGFIVEIVSKEGLTLAKLNSPLKVEALGGGLLEIARTVDNAYFIARHFNFPTTKQVLIDQIMSQEKRLSELRQFCDVNYPLNAIQATAKLGLELPHELAIPIARRIVFDDTSLVVVIVFAGKPTKTDVLANDWQNFIIEKPRRILQRHFMVSNDNFSSKQVDKLLKEISETLDAQGIDILVFEGKD